MVTVITVGVVTALSLLLFVGIESIFPDVSVAEAALTSVGLSLVVIGLGLTAGTS